MCRCAPSSRARRSRTRRRTAASRLPSSGASARSSGVSAETLTDRFARGMRPALSASSAGRSGQPAVDVDEAVERLAAARGVAVGLGGGDGRLAEQVDGRRHALAPEVLEHAGGLARRLADDEAVGHVLDAGGRGGAQRRAPGLGLRHAHRDLQRRRAVADLLQEAAEVAREVVERAAGGDDVDEAEQGGPQLGVLRGEVHRLVVDRPQRIAARPGQRRGEIAPDREDVGFRSRGGGHGATISRVGCGHARARPGSLPGGPMRSV